MPFGIGSPSPDSFQQFREVVHDAILLHLRTSLNRVSHICEPDSRLLRVAWRSAAPCFPSPEGIMVIFMAQRIHVLLTDDLDGGEAAGTVRFGLDGTEYEIDLSAAHSDELRTALQRYLAHARRTGSTTRGAARSRRTSAAVDTAKVREWAKGQGIEVKDRGRVPADVVEQYKTAAGA